MLTSKDVVGYVIRYYNPESEESRRYVEVGARQSQYTLEHISECRLYVDVAAKMKEDLVGPYSQGIDGRSLYKCNATFIDIVDAMCKYPTYVYISL